MIRAKFRCNSVRRFESGESVELTAVSDEANKQWTKWTPSGNLTMAIDNPDALGKFVPGKVYYLDFTPAD